MPKNTIFRGGSPLRPSKIYPRSIRKDLDRYFDGTPGKYGSEEQEMVAEVLTYLYPADDRPKHQYGTVGEFTEEFNRITGQQFSAQKIGRILKHPGIKTVIPPDDPKRSKVLVITRDDLDALAQQYGMERMHDLQAGFDWEFGVLLDEEHKRKYGVTAS